MTDAAAKSGFETWVARGTAGFGLVTTVLAGFTAASGDLTRMFRNYPFGTWAAVALMLGGILAAGAAFLPLPRNAKGKYLYALLGLSAGLFAIGLMVGFLIVAFTAKLAEQPSITANVKTDPALRLDATITESGLASKERLHVLVYGAPGVGDEELSRLFRADIGPDAEGSVELSLQIPLRPGLHRRVIIAAWSRTRFADTPDCNLSTGTSEELLSCAVVRLPLVALHSQLTAQFTGDDSATEAVEVTVKASDLGNRQLLALRVIGRRPGADPSVIYRGVLSPDQLGSLERTIHIPTAGRYKRVCVVVEEEVEGFQPECPSPGGVWLDLSSALFQP